MGHEEIKRWNRWWRTRGKQEVQALLMDYWDPIGVNDVPEAADEYDSYGLQVARMLRSGASADEIASYLRRVRVEWMELEWPEYDRRDRDVADRVVAWYAEAARNQ